MLRGHQLGRADAPVIRHGTRYSSSPRMPGYRGGGFGSGETRRLGSDLQEPTGHCGGGGERSGRSALIAAHFDFMLFGNFGPF